MREIIFKNQLVKKKQLKFYNKKYHIIKKTIEYNKQLPYNFTKAFCKTKL